MLNLGFFAPEGIGRPVLSLSADGKIIGLTGDGAEDMVVRVGPVETQLAEIATDDASRLEKVTISS